MPRPSKKRKAAIDREKQKKIKHYELLEDVSDGGYIREASSSNEWDIQVMHMAIPEIELSCPMIEDSFLPEFDYLEMELSKESDASTGRQMFVSKWQLSTYLEWDHFFVYQKCHHIVFHRETNRIRLSVNIGTVCIAGTGKNYASDFVAAALFEKGIESNFVNKFTATNTDKDLAYKVMQTVKKCEYSLFIFDEIEKMQVGVFDSIVSLLDHHSHMKGYDFSKSIFIFLSNSAGAEIAKKLKSLMDAGQFRDETDLADFQNIAQLGAYNMHGGLHHSKLIDSHVIDHFVPFLPLEPIHFEMCIRREFMLSACPNEARNEDSIRKIVKESMTFDDSKKFSNSGCKRISASVKAYCYKIKS